MDTSSLKEENRPIAESIWDATEHPAEEAWVCFWSEKSVQIDGDVTLDELKALVQIMEGFPS